MAESIPVCRRHEMGPHDPQQGLLLDVSHGAGRSDPEPVSHPGLGEDHLWPPGVGLNLAVEMGDVDPEQLAPAGNIFLVIARNAPDVLD